MAPPSRLEGFREGRGWGRIPPVLLYGGANYAESNMKKLYKYYPSSFDLAKYLKDPTIKISQLQHLNDPFEGMLTGEALGILIKKIQPILLPEATKKISDILYTKKHIKRQISSLGITSLSETSRNLLMWSHYASEHKGFCIGYKIPLIKPYKNKMINPPVLRKVNYDSLLFDHEHIEFLNTINDDLDLAIGKTVDRILTTKSESWSYEKEHRYITNIEQCDVIRFFKDKKMNPKYILEAVSKAIRDDSHDVIEDSDKIELTSKRTTSQLIHAISDPQSIEMRMKESRNTLFLKRIPVKNIDSIYFGVNFSKYIIEEIIDFKNSNKELSTINLYHYELSNERYEIIPYSLKE
ncbi:DUF2971 domain-containing protein [Aeromonas veronii]|uniref:DUF2971 domain-containing protein n=1 Tax=Aeromonas veronii TaxID=654 RepID=UPI003BA09EC4